MHYNTFPNIRVDPAAFARDAGTAGHRVHVLNAGDLLDL
jgi:L-ascorbate metabolism protein UlaG (beta-lactamase superfamily)